jgi:hypothetical protein
MDQKINVYLQVKTRYYRDSLAALLATVPGMIIYIGENYLIQPSDKSGKAIPDILLLEDSLPNMEQAVLLHNARQACPRMKIVLLVSSITSGLLAYPVDVDLILPVNTTARELIQSINRLVSCDSGLPDFCELEQMTLTN